MAHEGQELEGPNSVRLRLVRISDELLEMEASYGAEQPFPPPHLHPSQSERFTVLDGTIRTVIDGHERSYAAGESFDVAVGSVHQTAAKGPARLGWQVRPALRTAEFFETLYTGGAAADPAGFLAQYAKEIQLVPAPESAPDAG